MIETTPKYLDDLAYHKGRIKDGAIVYYFDQHMREIGYFVPDTMRAFLSQRDWHQSFIDKLILTQLAGDRTHVVGYAITHINRDGMRQLTYRNTGQHHFKNFLDAEERLQFFLANNSEENISQTLGDQAVGTFQVWPVRCYSEENMDAMGVFCADPNAPFDRDNKELLAELKQ